MFNHGSIQSKFIIASIENISKYEYILIMIHSSQNLFKKIGNKLNKTTRLPNNHFEIP